MVLTIARDRVVRGTDAVRGGIGFLSRVPIGRDQAAWEAFLATPTVFPLTGYLVGVLLSLPLVVSIPPPAVALVFIVWAYVVTGINHVDGVADVGDALVVHGDAARRRQVARDTTTGVGAILAVSTVIVGLALAALELAELPVRAVTLVVAAEVGAKLGMVLIAGLGSASHEGLGSQLTTRVDPLSIVPSVVVALPAGALACPNAAPAAAIGAAIGASLLVLWWARTAMGGVGGDVLGATNEVARLAALHAGVIVWTLS